MKRALAVLLFVAICLPVGIRPSAATFIAATANPDAQFSAAADFNTVSVALTDPGTPLRGTVPLAATAASDRGIADVTFQSAPAGTGTWSGICTDSSAPFTCSFDTTAVSDGLRDIRAVATDTAGYSRTDVATDRRVDNTAPIATTTDPGSPLQGTVSVGGTAVDTGSGVAGVTLQYRPAAGGWTDICTQGSSPATCSWNTAALADGLYDLRTVATDAAGNTGTASPVYNRRVDNTAPTVTMTAPGTPLAGSITLQSTSDDGSGSGVQSVSYEYRLSSGGTWATACTSSSTPFSCSFDTTAVTDDLYDFRAVATDGVALSTTSATVTSRRIDNTDPIGVTLGGVATPIQGTVALIGSAADAGSGVASLKFQAAPAGSGSWSDLCTDTAAPYTCAFDTASVADGLYDLRTLATDQAGNTTASAVQTNRRVDNLGPTVALTSPANGAAVSGNVTLTATATDGVGVASVTFEVLLGATWTPVCVDTTAPYTCAADSTQVADGAYDLRVTAVDTLTHTSTSTVVTITIDNTDPTAANVQGANGGTAGRIDAGDTLTFTWSEPMSPASILTGWNGASTAIRVRVTNNAGADTLDLWNAAGTTRLNVMSPTQGLQLQANWVATSTWHNATMVRSGNSVTVTIGTLISGTINTGVTTTANMIWTPSTAATDIAGNPTTNAPRTETGALDRDF